MFQNIRKRLRFIKTDRLLLSNRREIVVAAVFLFLGIPTGVFVNWLSGYLFPTERTVSLPEAVYAEMSEYSDGTMGTRGGIQLSYDAVTPKNVAGCEFQLDNHHDIFHVVEDVSCRKYLYHITDNPFLDESGKIDTPTARRMATLTFFVNLHNGKQIQDSVLLFTYYHMQPKMIIENNTLKKGAKTRIDIRNQGRPISDHFNCILPYPIRGAEIRPLAPNECSVEVTRTSPDHPQRQNILVEIHDPIGQRIGGAIGTILFSN